MKIHATIPPLEWGLHKQQSKATNSSCCSFPTSSYPYRANEVGNYGSLRVHALEFHAWIEHCFRHKTYVSFHRKVIKHRPFETFHVITVPTYQLHLSHYTGSHTELSLSILAKVSRDVRTCALGSVLVSTGQRLQKCLMTKATKLNIG